MKWRVVIRPRAETDLSQARDWYENEHAGLGIEFLVEIANVIANLVQDPERRPDYYRGFRRVLIPRFPYKLFYRLQDDRVVVFRVLHAHRNHPQLLR